MTNQSQGIQQLLAAEKIAADKVGEARKRKFEKSFYVCTINFFFLSSHVIRFIFSWSECCDFFNVFHLLIFHRLFKPIKGFEIM